MFEVKAFVSDCLRQKYHGPCITVMDGCCRKCLRGTPITHNIKKKSVRELMDEGEINPFQIASAFHIGSAYQAPYFKNAIINVKSEEKPCKYPGNCNQTCVLCFSFINSDGVDLCSGFQAHKACTSPCLYPCCKQRLPTLPAYLGAQRSDLMCDVHKDSDAFKRLSISPPFQKKPIYPPPKPISLRPPEPKTVPLPVKKTFVFKKLPKAKASKFERGNDVSILDFFKSPNPQNPKNPKDTKQADALAASKRPDAPRRFIRNKETGEVFGYWKGDQKFRIDNDEPLEFKSQSEKPYGSNITFDFTPPITLTNPSNT